MNNREKNKKPTVTDWIICIIFWLVVIVVVGFLLVCTLILILWYPGFAAFCLISGILAPEFNHH